MEFTYRGLKAELARHIITDAEIDRQIERLQQQSPRIISVNDRPAQIGDEVVLDYKGFCGEEQFAGGTAENQTLVLGSGMFIPGFEEQLVDKVPEEKVVVKVKFPEQYHSAELAGKDAEFHCVIHAIRVKTAYDLDDTFAKEVGRCETMDEMRGMLGQSLQVFSDERGEMDLQDRLLRMAADTLEFTPSEAQLQAEMDNQMRNLEAQLAQQGLNLDMYCQFMSTTKEQLREESRPNALHSVQMQAAIETIVDLEGLTAGEKDLEEAYELICQQNRMTMDQLKDYIDAEFEQAVARSVLSSKAMQLIRENAEITYTTDET